MQKKAAESQTKLVHELSTYIIICLSKGKGEAVKK